MKHWSWSWALAPLLLPLSCSAGASGPSAHGSGASDGGGTSGMGEVIVGSGGNVAVGGGLNLGPCAADGKTTVSGVVYDPAGKVPLYNVVVYVPQPGTELPPIAEGASCDQCSGSQASGIAVALSDASGHFVLEDVPSGSDVPLVLQVGKWRRQVTIPNVVACQDNPLDDPNLTRLPRNQAEGHLPKIALSTGHSDALECLLRKIGIDDAEFTIEGGSGRVNLFVGCAHQETGFYGANQFAPELGGDSFPAATGLFGDQARLDAYDMIVLSCEGHRCAEQKDPYMANIKAYADKGGRLFFDHMHFYWMSHSESDWEGAANITGVGDDLPTPYDVLIDDTFPKGSALADWLVNVGASPTRGTLSILEGQYSIAETFPPKTQRWIYLNDHPTAGGPATQYMTMNTPVELAETDPDSQCGRIVYTDLHVTAGPGSDFSDEGTPFPGGCTTSELSPQEKALAFMLFDLSSCVQKESVAPEPPPVVK